MTDWAAKVLEGVPRAECWELDPDAMRPSNDGDWVRWTDALAAIARMGAGDGLVGRLQAYSSMDDHLSHRSDTERRAAASIAALTERNDWLSNLSHTAAEKGMKAEAERDALRERVARLEGALVEHNDLLRSALSIAKREGVDGEIASTNWDAYYNRVAVVLKRHHQTANDARAAISEGGKDG